MSNTGILKKVLEELSKDSPRLDYVRGMVETLVDMQETGQPVTPVHITRGESTPLDTPLPPLGDLNRIKAIAEQSME